VPWVLERTIPTKRQPLVGEVSVNFLWIEGATWSAWRIPYCRILGFLDRSRYRYVYFQVAPQLYSWGWVDPVPDPLLLRKFGSPDLWICSQELWPLDHRRGHHKIHMYIWIHIYNFGKVNTFLWSPLLGNRTYLIFLLERSLQMITEENLSLKRFNMKYLAENWLKTNTIFV
jgi:hypothetical protein